jgi:hypothetical protein
MVSQSRRASVNARIAALTRVLRLSEFCALAAVCGQWAADGRCRPAAWASSSWSKS